MYNGDIELALLYVSGKILGERRKIMNDSHFFDRDDLASIGTLSVCDITSAERI